MLLGLAHISLLNQLVDGAGVSGYHEEIIERRVCVCSSSYQLQHLSTQEASKMC